MFDIGFWELALIGVVALLVVGPERLPGLARTAGMWVGRLRRFVSSVKSDIDRELRADELRQALNKPQNDIYEILEDRTPVTSAKQAEETSPPEASPAQASPPSQDPIDSPADESARRS